MKPEGKGNALEPNGKGDAFGASEMKPDGKGCKKSNTPAITTARAVSPEMFGK